MRTLGVALIAVSALAAEAPSRYADLDGLRVHYKSYGSGREAVVFIHGWTCDLTFWSGQAPVYEKRRSLLIDLPGHGRSDQPEVSYTQELFARAVERVMRDAGVERAVLVGHSMGTPVAITFLRLFPKKAAGLVIVDGFAPPPPKDDAEKQKQAAQREAFVKMFRSPDYKANMTKMIDSMFRDPTAPELRERIRSKMLATPQHVLASAMEGMMALNYVTEPFDLPALAIMAKPRQPRASYEEQLRKSFPNLRGYQEWDGAGHFLMMESPERFNAALIEFLDKK